MDGSGVRSVHAQSRARAQAFRSPCVVAALAPEASPRPAGRFVSRPSITHRGLIRWEERNGLPVTRRTRALVASRRCAPARSLACFPISGVSMSARLCVDPSIAPLSPPRPRARRGFHRRLRRVARRHRSPLQVDRRLRCPPKFREAARPPATGGRLSPDRTCVTVRERDSLRPGTAAG